MTDYEHPDHGEIVEHKVDAWNRDMTIEGLRCEVCHVIADPENPDETFDEHDCEQYERVRKGIAGEL
jgi:hypothetical protein